MYQHKVIKNSFLHVSYNIHVSYIHVSVKRQGVAIVIENEWAKCISSYECISERLMSVTFDTMDGPLTIFQIYAPDSSYKDEIYEEFYDTIQEKINALPRINSYLILGDFNAKVGSEQHENWPETVGRYGLGKTSDRGSQLLQFCAINGLVITNTLFRHSSKRRATWISPDNRTMNQIDYIIVQGKWKTKVKNSRAYHSADIGSDHFLVLANIEVRISGKKQKRATKTPKRFDVDKLQNSATAEEFQIQIGGAFEPLIGLETNNIEEVYSQFKNVTNRVTEQVVGYKRKKQIRGLPPEIEEACAQRRKARRDMLNSPGDEAKREEYMKLNHEVKKAIKKQKNNNIQEKVEEIEMDFKKNNSHNLFKHVREIEGKGKKNPSVW